MIIFCSIFEQPALILLLGLDYSIASNTVKVFDDF